MAERARDSSGKAPVREGTKLQRAQRRLDVLVRCLWDYHPQHPSQTVIADALGVSQQAISRSLQRTDPDDPEVRRIAALLGWIKLTTNHAYGAARARTCGHIL